MRLTKDAKECIKLGWWLLERKVAYYRPEAIHTTRIKDYVVSDEDYDAAELRYLELIRKLQKVNAKSELYKDCGPYPVNTLVHKGWPGYEDLCTETAMMEIDDKRPSVQLVLKKLGSIKY